MYIIPRNTGGQKDGWLLVAKRRERDTTALLWLDVQMYNTSMTFQQFVREQLATDYNLPTELVLLLLDYLLLLSNL